MHKVLPCGVTRTRTLSAESRRAALVIASAAVTATAFAEVGAAVTVGSTAEFHAAAAARAASGGTIVLAPGRYGELSLGARGSRWLTIVARPGASAGGLRLVGTRAVRVDGLRVTPRARSVNAEIRNSRSITLRRVKFAGSGRLLANVSVLFSRDVAIRSSEFTRCGEGVTPHAGYCVRLYGSSDVVIAASNFHDCFGCDFVHGTRTSGLTIRDSSFQRALMGRCGRSVRDCHHQDPVDLQEGRDILIDRNRFGVYQFPGAGQVNITGDVRGVTITNNLFVGTDPRVPGVRSQTALWIGNRRETEQPRRVLIANNTILTGAGRVLRNERFPVRTSILLPWRYAQLPRAERPLVANNVIALLRSPQRKCPFVREFVANVVLRGSACSAANVVGDPALDARGRPTAASTLLIDRADRRFAPGVDLLRSPRAVPDIGAFEYRGE